MKLSLSDIYYLAMSLQEGNIFSYVCQSVQGPFAAQDSNPSPPVQGPGPQYMFKLVHLEAEAIEKSVVGIRLK